MIDTSAGAHRVVFRKWKDSGAIIALFPELPSDVHGHFCVSYEHVGQHAAADYPGVINQTFLATPAEFAALAEELARIGYWPKPQKRASWRHHEQRRQLAKAS